MTDEELTQSQIEYNKRHDKKYNQQKKRRGKNENCN